MVEPDRPQTRYNTAHAHCILDSYGYRLTLRIYNSPRFCMTKTVTRTRLNITFIRRLPVL
jgi:hypothetical protein